MFLGRPFANPTARRTEAAIPTGVRPCDRPAVARPSALAVRRAVYAPVRATIRYGRSAGPTARRTASSVPRRSARPFARPSTTRTAFSLIPAPRSPPPPPPTVLSTVGFLGEYKEGSTNTLNLLPNLCFPRALSCTLHLLLGKPLLRKSKIVLGVSFGTPNTISAAWLLHSFIPYFCPHRNGQQTMVPLVH